MINLIFSLMTLAYMPSIIPNPISIMVKQEVQPDEFFIRKTYDFEISGNGSAKEWDAVEWLKLPARCGAAEKMETKVKSLYSSAGIYFLFQCSDKVLTSTKNEDYMDLWKEDVVEVFLWPDESVPAYFEYEISPLSYELPLLISNENGDLVRWIPFHYDADRRTRHATAVEGGEKKSLAGISSWSAEFFIPFKLLRPLNNHVPVSGTRWRANLYRVDYDNSSFSSWSWQLTRTNFHDIQRFGVFVFE
jgi:hypothetical protein